MWAVFTLLGTEDVPTFPPVSMHLGYECRAGCKAWEVEWVKSRYCERVEYVLYTHTRSDGKILVRKSRSGIARYECTVP